MYATTWGIGPYHPMVVFNGVMWVSTTFYFKEEDAFTKASIMLTLLKTGVEELFSRNDFYSYTAEQLAKGL